MRTDEKIESDLRALARATTRGLPSVADTARALEAARGKGASPMSKIRRPLFAGALTIAAAAAILVFPVPYSRQRGYDVTFTGADGRVAHLHLSMADRAKAEARALALAHGAKVEIQPRRERVWGSVYAMAAEKLFHLDIDVEGKTQAQIEEEIKKQLTDQGWDIETIDVHGSDDGLGFSVTANSGDGQRHMEIKTQGGVPASLHLHLEGLDVRREPGMSDEQLKQKILDQMKTRGLEGEVTVKDGQVQVRAEKRCEKPDEKE
jgi:hypothetical protein